MRHLSLLIKRELFDNLTSSRYVLTSTLCLALCLTSIIVMTSDYERRLKRASLSNWWSLAKPVEPLSLLARGTDEFLGREFTAQDHPRYQVIGQIFHHYGEEHHIFDLFTTPDFVYFISTIMSAFAIFLSCDSICREKETGTLSLLLSHSLPRTTLLIAKWLGGYTSFLVSLLPAFLLLLIFLALFAGVPLQTQHWIRISAIFVLSLMYLSVFFTLGLFISALTQRPATALILGLFIWAIWVLGTARVGLLAVRTISPVQSEGEHRRAKERVATRHEISEQERETLWEMDDAYIATVDRQITKGQSFARLSPMASYVYASTTLAQTGIPDYLDFRSRVSQWVRDNVRAENEARSDFVHRNLSLDRSLAEIYVDLLAIYVDLLAITLWNVMLFMGANLAFLRYDVR